MHQCKLEREKDKRCACIDMCQTDLNVYDNLSVCVSVCVCGLLTHLDIKPEFIVN